MTGSWTAAWAESYAALGWRIFPAHGKVPAFAGWQQAASTHPSLINRWWPRDDDSNVAVVTGESFDVFDIEVEHVPAFVAFMKAGDLSFPLTPVASTGRGGLHTSPGRSASTGRAGCSSTVPISASSSRRAALCCSAPA